MEIEKYKKEKKVKTQTKELKTKTSLRNLGLTLTLPAQPECTVSDCFTDPKIFAYRDSDFDNLLPTTLPASAAVSVNGYELTKVTTEAELAKNGTPFTNLSQIEHLILRTKKGENTGLITNGYANISFLKVDNSVFTVRAYRLSGGWRVCLYRFIPRCGWDAGHRFFSSAT